MSFHINVEIKAKSENIAFIREYLDKHATDKKGVDRQKDTYFETKHGRLKLREGNIENSLILYNRPDSLGPKQSDVNLVKLSPDSGMRKLLAKSNQIKVVVEKIREIFFIDNVKFHIDKVNGLGDFIEIEAIDFDGTLGKDELHRQCKKYIDIFGIAESDFVDSSYSDLILKLGREFRENLNVEFNKFIQALSFSADKAGLELNSYSMDHVCWRVESEEQYQKYKELFRQVGDLLTESKIGGRNISTFKLFKPLSKNAVAVDVVELPQPKKNNRYALGFEHAEHVIDESFEEFAAKHPKARFDWSGADKRVNPELRLRFNQNMSLKFHHQSLELVIEEEAKQVNCMKN